MIAIVDYEAGNIGSIKNMLQNIGVASIISSDPGQIRLASKIILPGVSAFDYGMTKLKDSGILPVLHEKRKANTPILGICLGAQLMCNKSEEGKLPGLGWMDADVVRFPGMVEGKKLPVPHIGWDHVAPKKNSKLFENLPEPARFYFVHSYYIRCHAPADSLASNQYGAAFDAAFESGNIAGVQFHPEKSHKVGHMLLKNFSEKF